MRDEEVKKLQEELNRLSAQLQAQGEEVRLLQERLKVLQGAAPAPQPVSVRPVREERDDNHALENFIGLRLIHVIGMVVLVIGLSIGVKYAIDRDLISEGMRIALAYGAGILLFLLSVGLRLRYEGFSAILFSGAMASLYFTTYGAYVYYAMLPFAAAFAFMILLTLFTAWRAIGYNRQEIALLGLVGAYSIPFLISANSDRADLFFLYISLINSGVVYLSIRKAWKGVGRVAQFATWLLFLGWGFMDDRSAQLGTGVTAMVFFFLLFSLNALSPRLFHGRELDRNDAHLLLLNGIALYLGTLELFVTPFEMERASLYTLMHALLMGAFAFALRIWRERYAQILFAVSALLLLLMFISMEWDGLTVTLLWLLMAVLVFVWGFWQKSVVARLLSITLMGATLFKLVTFDSQRFTTVQKVVSYLLLGGLLLVVSYLYQKFRGKLFEKEE